MPPVVGSRKAGLLTGKSRGTWAGVGRQCLPYLPTGMALRNLRCADRDASATRRPGRSPHPFKTESRRDDTGLFRGPAILSACFLHAFFDNPVRHQSIKRLCRCNHFPRIRQFVRSSALRRWPAHCRSGARSVERGTRRIGRLARVGKSRPLPAPPGRLPGDGGPAGERS